MGVYIPPTHSQITLCEGFMLTARTELGVHEIPGAQHSERVLTYLATCGKAPIYTRDETPWCSAFANWVVQQTKGLTGTGKANARSWLTWGDKLDPRTHPDDIPRGAVVVFSRLLPHQGHVGFFDRRVGDLVYVCGGNQGNRVSVRPYHARRLLDIRVPALRDITPEMTS